MNLGVCNLDIPTLFLLVIMAACMLVHIHQQKKQEKELEEELKELQSSFTKAGRDAD